MHKGQCKGEFELRVLPGAEQRVMRTTTRGSVRITKNYQMGGFMSTTREQCKG